MRIAPDMYEIGLTAGAERGATWRKKLKMKLAPSTVYGFKQCKNSLNSRQLGDLLNAVGLCLTSVKEGNGDDLLSRTH